MKVRPEGRDGRRALIEAALAIASEGGEVGLRDCARRAGLTAGAPYRHFKSHEALIAAAAEEGFRALHAACVEAESKASPAPLARFQALGVAYLTFALERPGLFRLMFVPFERQSTVTRELRSSESGVFALIVRAIVEGQRAGVIVEGDAQELALVAWGAAHGAATLVLGGLVEWVGLGRSTPRSLSRRVTHQVFVGLQKR